MLTMTTLERVRDQVPEDLPRPVAPIALAAETKSRVRRVSTSPRTRRAGTSHEKNPMTIES